MSNLVLKNNFGPLNVKLNCITDGNVFSVFEAVSLTYSIDHFSICILLDSIQTPCQLQQMTFKKLK